LITAYGYLQLIFVSHREKKKAVKINVRVQNVKVKQGITKKNKKLKDKKTTVQGKWLPG